MALAGDSSALRLCMDRIAPAPKARPIHFPMPPARTAEQIDESIARIIEAVGDGVITSVETSGLASLLDARRRNVEMLTLEMRITALEQAAKQLGEEGQ